MNDEVSLFTEFVLKNTKHLGQRECKKKKCIKNCQLFFCF